MSSLTEADKQMIAANLDKPEDELFAFLGEAAIADGGVFSGVPPSLQKRIEAGKNYLELHRQDICERLRTDPKTRDFLRHGATFDRVEAAYIIGDVLFLSLGHPTVLWMAICLIRTGLSTVCPDPATLE